MNDEKYFKLTGNNITTSIQLIQLQLFHESSSNVKAKVMIWMVMSSKGTFDIYVRKSKQAVNQETYLKECIYYSKYHSNGNDLF